MQGSKPVLICLLDVFNRICWAGLAYSIIGLLLVLFNVPKYDQNLNTYILGLLISLSWLFFVPFVKGRIEDVHD